MKGEDLSHLKVEADNLEREKRAARLRQAVRAAGGNRVVSEKSGVKVGTLADYLAGGEQKLSNTIALAEACGVSLEWLATGAGPMKSEEFPAAVAPRAVGLSDHQQALATIRSVGARLLAAIDEAGGPLVVAERAGMLVDALADAAGGNVELRVSALVALADACNVSVEWLATGRPPPAQPAPLDVRLLAQCIEKSIELQKSAGEEWTTATFVRVAVALYDAVIKERSR